MKKLQEVHQDIYNFLIDRRKKEPSLKYTLRKTNYAGRLEEGYWFYGNEKFFAISFWTGMDWKNRTPNIIILLTDEGKAQLEINVSDSHEKREFAEKYIIRRLDLKPEGRRYIKRYGVVEDDILGWLDWFLKNDKRIIDEIIEKESNDFFTEGPSDATIKFIPQKEFYDRDKKIKNFLIIRNELSKEEGMIIEDDSPSMISSMQIKNYGPIKHASLEDLNSKWIFFTGENGSGKTCLLRVVGATLGNKAFTKKEIGQLADFEAKVKFISSKPNGEFYQKTNATIKGKRQLVKGLAMYGPYRLDIVTNRTSITNFRKKLLKDGSFKSLFNYSEPLLNIDIQFSIWSRGSNSEKKRFEERKHFIKNIFAETVPGLTNIKFKGEEQSRETLYFFQDEEGPLVWGELSSGNKNIIALLGDILIRLYNQQKSVVDPADLTGVVVIDEIDLHLHPKAQKELVVNLSNTFRSVQFFVSTHSPIPLLGAPKSSIFYKINRSKEEGIHLQRLSKLEKDIKYLLPNSILTSDIFEFDDIESITNDDLDKTKLESYYSDIEKNNQIKERLERVDPNIFPDNLFTDGT